MFLHGITVVFMLQGGNKAWNSLAQALGRENLGISGGKWQVVGFECVNSTKVSGGSIWVSRFLKLINSHLLNKSDLLPVFKSSNHLTGPCGFLSFETLTTCVPVIFDL